ncbi:MAG TPA: hypothetical protein VKA08_11270 [Balneolales bacterium]|nr:hypothetical protein [Balneolales bacterium]
MRPLLPSEKKIIGLLVFAESYDSLLNDSGLQPGELRDDLINLIDAGLIQVFESSDNKNPVPTFYCDTDHLEQFSFRATRSGLNTIKVQEYEI